jgi:O-phosphoseryl-tRNA synthetase
VERLAMILTGSEDVRVLSYPQFYPRDLTDRELAGAVYVRDEPATVTGRLIARAICETGMANPNAPGPCSFIAWEGELLGHHVKVFLEELEENAKLLGPACGNEVFVHQGNILGIPDNEKWAQIRKEGVSTGIVYLDAVAALAAARIEEAARCGKGITVQVKMSKFPSDVNLKVEEHAMRSITDRKKKIDVRGPVFVTVRAAIEGSSG